MVTLLSAYVMSNKGYGSDYLRYAMIALAVICLAYDAYAYIILPEQISQFYRNGSGTSFNNSTMFSNSDGKIAYFMARTANDWSSMENLMYIAGMLVGLVLVLLAVRYLTTHNAYGDQTDAYDKKLAFYDNRARRGP